MPDKADNAKTDTEAQPVVNPVKSSDLEELYKPLAIENPERGYKESAAYGADNLAAVLALPNLKIALAAVAMWEEG
ncbi:hypothetical protein [Agrobacterium vitis]|uniref:hypothetical protein n=1 Tax=Agrobacterium vitis TaxID=373 RepID=UPI00114CAD9C|nr:hypothetical protein [Agrobacterium vitis]MUO72913.1 hypothetical protein [Agrobacterium vitis]